MEKDKDTKEEYDLLLYKESFYFNSSDMFSMDSLYKPLRYFFLKDSKKKGE